MYKYYRCGLIHQMITSRLVGEDNIGIGREAGPYYMNGMARKEENKYSSKELVFPAKFMTETYQHACSSLQKEYHARSEIQIEVSEFDSFFYT